LVTPYFLSYALAWFSLVVSDKKMVGAFSIGYRIVIGLSALAGPMVFYMMARGPGSNSAVSFRKTLLAAIVGTFALWALGVAVVAFYFQVSKVDPALWTYCIQSFSILMLGLFFIFFRTPYVSRCAISGHYRGYFLIHLMACAPLLAFSLTLGRHVSGSMVPWLACLPDFFAAVGFVYYYKFRLSSHEVAFAEQDKP
jgi:hypothetical protein